MSVKSVLTSLIYAAMLLLNTSPAPTKSQTTHLPLHIFKSSFYLHRGNTSSSSTQVNRFRVVQRELTSQKDINNNLKGYSGDGYYIDMNIGTPGQQMKILIDTGSSNFAVAAYLDPDITDYFRTERSTTFQNLGIKVYVPYTEGEWTGVLGMDNVSLVTASGLNSRVNIACIKESRHFFVAGAEWQGIVGFGYRGLSQPDPSVVPFWDSLRESNPNLRDIFSMRLCGTSFVHTDDQQPLLTGSLILGGVDKSMAKSPLIYTPIIRELYYEIILTNLEVDYKPLNLPCKEFNFDKTIVDSGTTNIRLPNRVFNAVVAAIETKLKTSSNISGPSPDFFTGEDILCYSDIAMTLKLFPVITFSVMGSENSSYKLHVTPQHYLRPVKMVTQRADPCVKFGFSPTDHGTVLGAVFMEAFYVVFDREQTRIGFAQTSCPLPDPRNPILEHNIEGPFYANTNYTQCQYFTTKADEESFLILAYIMIAMSVIIFIPLFLMCVLWLRGKYRTAESLDASETQNVLSE